MQLSIREATARFAEAAVAAATGDRVVITKHGKPIVELIAVRTSKPVDWERAMEIRKELGIVGTDASWFDEFIRIQRLAAACLASTIKAPSRYAFCRLAYR